MDDGVRTAILWILMPICIYLMVPISAMVCTLLTPPFIHDDPRRAAWPICFSTFITFAVTQGAGWDREIAALFVLGVGLWWHFSKYVLLFQLTRDPILRFFLSDADKFADEMKKTFKVKLRGS